MASLFAHAALPVVVLAAVRIPDGERKRLTIAAAICAAVPDLDIVTAVFEVRAYEPTGHRGLAHSLVMAALIASFVAIVWFRRVGLWGAEWRRILAILFAATASHGLLDTMTTGELGVALFSPLSPTRFFFPWKLLPSCPVGVNEMFGLWGLFTIANELLYLILPVGIVVAFLRAKEGERPRLARAAVIWAVVATALRLFVPEYFAPTLPRVVKAIAAEDKEEDIPHDDLPGGKLVRRWDELGARGAFGRTLSPASPTWSSSFFPSWFGGEGGRWTDDRGTLVWRTLVGFTPESEAKARGWLSAAQQGDEAATKRIFALAPTEKVDLAFGRLDFATTMQALRRSHNGRPRFWNGRCAGISIAAATHPEPYRVVDVIGVDGTRIPFHPNDVKALLSVVYDPPAQVRFVGQTCEVVAFDSGAACSMNPALLVLAIANRLGIARESILVDAIPTIAKQYYAVAEARIDVDRAPYAAAGGPIDPAIASRVAKLVDVAIELTLSSTTLRYEVADRRDEQDPSGSTYRKVGFVPVVMRYRATIGLDATSEIVGGRWTGDPADGPDLVLVAGGGPRLKDEKNLELADRLSWPFIRELARASADGGAAHPTLDLRTQCDGACR